ncbi:MAG TPA: hypothetical protein VN803_03015 [Gemmatimonadales bacterium]|nr:hypothetical protein [Gemmatimonadales bacterium]
MSVHAHGDSPELWPSVKRAAEKARARLDAHPTPKRPLTAEQRREYQIFDESDPYDEPEGE